MANETKKIQISIESINSEEVVAWLSNAGLTCYIRIPMDEFNSFLVIGEKLDWSVDVYVDEKYGEMKGRMSIDEYIYSDRKQIEEDVKEYFINNLFKFN